MRLGKGRTRLTTATSAVNENWCAPQIRYVGGAAQHVALGFGQHSHIGTAVEIGPYTMLMRFWNGQILTWELEVPM